MSWSLLEIVASIWAVIIVVYVALFLYRSVFGMHEEDTLYLSAGETRMAEAQQAVMKRMAQLDSYTRKIGYAALAMTVVLAAVWVYGVIKQFL
jgi:hypothetical protein